MKPERTDGAAAVVKRADAVASREVAAGTATSSQVLVGPDDGAPVSVVS